MNPRRLQRDTSLSIRSFSAMGRASFVWFGGPVREGFQRAQKGRRGHPSSATGSESTRVWVRPYRAIGSESGPCVAWISQDIEGDGDG